MSSSKDLYDVVHWQPDRASTTAPKAQGLRNSAQMTIVEVIRKATIRRSGAHCRSELLQPNPGRARRERPENCKRTGNSLQELLAWPEALRSSFRVPEELSASGQKGSVARLASQKKRHLRHKISASHLGSHASANALANWSKASQLATPTAFGGGAGCQESQK